MGLNSRRNTPITQHEVETRIIELWDRLEEETEEFEDLAREDAEKTALAKIEWAKAYLQATGTEKTRSSTADWQTEKYFFDAKVAEAVLRSKRERLTSLRSGLDALRTLAANTRASLGS